MFSYIAIAIGILVTARILLLIENPKRDFTQNTARYTDAADDPTLQPIVTDGKPADAVARLRDWLLNTPGWVEIGQAKADSEGAFELHLTRTTPVMRFVDDIHVSFTPHVAGGGVRIDAISQSRIGKGDLGQNPRNLRQLRSAFE